MGAEGPIPAGQLDLDGQTPEQIEAAMIAAASGGDAAAAAALSRQYTEAVRRAVGAGVVNLDGRRRTERQAEADAVDAALGRLRATSSTSNTRSTARSRTSWWGLSPRERLAVATIRAYMIHRGSPPTVRELAEACELRSIGSVSYLLTQLQGKGWLTREPGHARAIRLTEAP